MKDWALALCFAVPVVVLGLFPAAAQDRRVIRLATQVLPPYQMIHGGEMTGIGVERVKCALDRMGRPYEIHMIPWVDAQTGTENGEFEGFFAGSVNSARAKYSTPSVPVFSLDRYWYMPKGADIDPTNPEDMLKARYSAKFATSKWLYLKRNGYNVVKKPRDAESLLNMLKVGDIDVALEYELIFEHFMKEQKLPPDYFQKIFLEGKAQMVHFSNRYLDANPLFLPRFNDELSRCVRETS